MIFSETVYKIHSAPSPLWRWHSSLEFWFLHKLQLLNSHLCFHQLFKGEEEVGVYRSVTHNVRKPLSMMKKLSLREIKWFLPTLHNSKGSSWGRKWHPTPVFLSERFHARGVWGATVHGVIRSQTRQSTAQQGIGHSLHRSLPHSDLPPDLPIPVMHQTHS